MRMYYKEIIIFIACYTLCMSIWLRMVCVFVKNSFFAFLSFMQKPEQFSHTLSNCTLNIQTIEAITLLKFYRAGNFIFI